MEAATAGPIAESPGNVIPGKLSLPEELGPVTFKQKVERVAECLAGCCLAGSLELDTRENAVHAYVDAHYISANQVAE